MSTSGRTSESPKSRICVSNYGINLDTIKVTGLNPGLQNVTKVSPGFLKVTSVNPILDSKSYPCKSWILKITTVNWIGLLGVPEDPVHPSWILSLLTSARTFDRWKLESDVITRSRLLSISVLRVYLRQVLIRPTLFLTRRSQTVPLHLTQTVTEEILV